MPVMKNETISFLDRYNKSRNGEYHREVSMKYGFWLLLLLGNLWQAAVTKNGWIRGVSLISSAIFAIFFGMGYKRNKWGK